MTYINEHQHLFGVEPICRTLTAHGWPIASGTYRAAVRRLPSTRARRDAWLAEHIRRVHAGNYGVYGARKVWLTLNREGIAVARCTVERLMRWAAVIVAAVWAVIGAVLYSAGRKQLKTVNPLPASAAMLSWSRLLPTAAYGYRPHQPAAGGPAQRRSSRFAVQQYEGVRYGERLARPARSRKRPAPRPTRSSTADRCSLAGQSIVDHLRRSRQR